MEIKNRIIKSALVNWRSFLFIQSKSFKEFADVDYNKLRESVIKNQFVESFKVWQTKEGLYCLDGYHRCKVLSDLVDDGYNVPDKFHADFIECTGKKEAAKLVLIYSSIYAKPTYTGIQDFLAEYDLNIADINAEIDLPEIDLELLNGAGLNPLERISLGKSDLEDTKFITQINNLRNQLASKIEKEKGIDIVDATMEAELIILNAIVSNEHFTR